MRLIVHNAGTKEIELVTVHGSLGGRNTLLSYTYAGVGALCMFLGLVFLSKECRRSSGEGDAAGDGRQSKA